MRHHRLLQGQVPWALGLVLAMLLLSSWGQWHRVLHPGASAASALAQSPAAHGHDASAHFGHDAGGSLCLLLDHLADGSAASQTPLLPTANAPSAAPSGLAVRAVRSAAIRAFDARGPPSIA